MTTHYKNYRIIRTRDGLALENCALGDGDIDVVGHRRAAGEAQPADQPEHRNPLAIRPFPARRVAARPSGRGIPSPPGDGLAWYLEKSWTKAPLEPWPDNLADGAKAWERIEDRATSAQSVRWAQTVR